MCGIVGAVAERNITPILVEGLKRLEYRGYDSAGVAVLADGVMEVRKKAGKVAALDAELAANPLPVSPLGIGHTRWATHGGPTDQNAHPHRGGRDGKLAVVHNGIIENFRELRAELAEQGFELELVPSLGSQANLAKLKPGAIVIGTVALFIARRSPRAVAALAWAMVLL